ncbi:hypothetical protein [Chlamydia gallinacea]|uniref:hypothetical protein n=1 Tax=Chlamydia gallinacea TaxID=1457153 RepID=UPI002180A32B|nr:hypothetical protein [Chlamydia gallinacea]
MSCSKIAVEMKDGLGFSGISSSKLANKNVHVNICRVVFALFAAIVGLSSLIYGIGVCAASTFFAMSVAGASSILLSFVLLGLAMAWAYGVFLSCHGKKLKS